MAGFVMLVASILLNAAHAVTPVLLVPSEYETLQDAHDAAKDGQIIEIDASALPSGGLVENVSVTRSVTFRGVKGQAHLVSDHHDDGVFKINGNPTVHLEQLRLDGNGDSRVVLLQQGDVTLNQVHIENTTNPAAGGAIRVENDAQNALTVRHSTFANTASSEDGGAIKSLGANILIEDSTFTGGAATRHGGAIATEGAGNLDINRCTFSANTAGDRGGAVYARSTGTLVVLSSTFTHNTADKRGGGLNGEGTYSVWAEDNLFEGNSVPNGDGGGFYLRRETATLHRNVFCFNTASGLGGGLYARDDITNSNYDVFIGNVAADGGGAHVVTTGNFVHSSFSANAADEGQAIAGHELTVSDSYVGDHAGKGVAITGSDLEVQWSWFTDNAGGNYSAVALTDVFNTLKDPGLGTPVPKVCDPEVLRPDPKNPLVGAASDESTVGALEPEIEDIPIDSAVTGHTGLQDSGHPDDSADSGRPATETEPGQRTGPRVDFERAVAGCGCAASSPDSLMTWAVLGLLLALRRRRDIALDDTEAHASGVPDSGPRTGPQALRMG